MEVKYHWNIPISTKERRRWYPASMNKHFFIRVEDINHSYKEDMSKSFRKFEDARAYYLRMSKNKIFSVQFCILNRNNEFEVVNNF